MESEAIVWTEGKTDWQHLKHALRVLNIPQRIAFRESEEEFGDDQLLKQCIALARVPQPCPTIFVFDRDNDDIIQKVTDPKAGFKNWGNNVYSFTIPLPPHREGYSHISIEFYYTDNELFTPDPDGRRLFLSSEFNSASGRHREIPSLSLGNKGKYQSTIQKGDARLIDSDVYDDQNRNVALTKSAFAQNLIQNASASAFVPFHSIFSLITRIIDQARPRTDLIFGDINIFLEKVKALEPPEQLASVVEALVNSCKLLATIFTAVTLRYYEQQNLNETKSKLKKVRPIRQQLISSFDHPSLMILNKAAQSSYHLIDAEAPPTLCILRQLLVETPMLGPVGELLDMLERLIPPPAKRARSVEKYQLRKPVLEFILPEFAKYEGRVSEINRLASSNPAARDADPQVWRSAVEHLAEIFKPLGSLVFRARNLSRMRLDSAEFCVTLLTYRNGRIGIEDSTQMYEDLKDDQLDRYEVVLDSDSDMFVDIYPFLIIKNDRLLYYKRSGATGHEYGDAYSNREFRVVTKRKFSHLALGTRAADKQSLFWQDIEPIVSDSGVKANIPTHGPIVGRKQQLSILMEEVIQIPNQNAIVHGPGGVGKTALLIELSRYLALEQVPPPFANIVWVSAKRDYYDPTRDVIESGEPQFHSLDNILAAILDFHAFEDASAYDHDAKKWFVIELLKDNKTLLVLDNLETLTESAQKEIVRFFGVDAKKELRSTPDQFKVLITSRELIPSGFHQIELKGLDQDESTELTHRLFEPYRHSGHQPLTDEQTVGLYDVTRGIPLIIKHCFGQIYEYNRPFQHVLRQLTQAGNRVVEFSFAEILSLLKQDDLQLRILLLLELGGRPLMPRQIVDILDVPESDVSDRLARLVAFQCVDRTASTTADKYGVSDEARFFTQRLLQQYSDIATAIKKQFANLSFEKRMDYTQDEADTAMLFQEYMAKRKYLPAEDFMRERLSKQPYSVLLSLHYARYLSETKHRVEDAIELLEKIRVRSGNDPQVLMRLMTYYAALVPPKFDQAYVYARELEEVAGLNSEVQFEIAKFYVLWSTSIKVVFEPDRLKEGIRQQTYKEHADNAIRMLERCQRETHEWHHLAAQSYYNKWEYERALQHISVAIKLAAVQSHVWKSSMNLRAEIIEKRSHYQGRKVIDRYIANDN